MATISRLLRCSLSLRMTITLPLRNLFSVRNGGSRTRLLEVLGGVVSSVLAGGVSRPGDCRRSCCSALLL